MHDVVVVERISLPNPLLDNRLVDITILVSDEFSLAGLIDIHAEVRAHEELALEELDTDNSEHEYEQDCHSHNVADGFH